MVRRRARQYPALAAAAISSLLTYKPLRGSMAVALGVKGIILSFVALSIGGRINYDSFRKFKTKITIFTRTVLYLYEKERPETGKERPETGHDKRQETRDQIT